MNSQQIHALALAISQLTESQFEEWFAAQPDARLFTLSDVKGCLLHSFVTETLSVPDEAKLEFTWEDYELNHSGTNIPFRGWMKEMTDKIKSATDVWFDANRNGKPKFYTSELRKILKKNN